MNDTTTEATARVPFSVAPPPPEPRDAPPETPTPEPVPTRTRRTRAPRQKAPDEPRRLISVLSSAERKKYPIVEGCIDYFPDAIAYVAHVSWVGNNKHNPGQPLHHARGKSSDHADCQGRHMIERDSKDENGVWHMGCKAWRALAELQEFLEKKHDLTLPRAATEPGVELPRQ